MLALLGVVVIAVCVAFAATAVARLSGPLQAPNGRSNHIEPTPLGGGVAVLLGVAAAMMWATSPWGVLSWETHEASPMIDTGRLGGVLAVAAMVGALGVVDDIAELGPRVKLVSLVSLSAALVWVAGPAVTLGWVEGEKLPYALAFLGSLMWVFTVVNAVNFMDGANGLVSGALALASVGLAFIGFMNGAVGAAVCALALAAALGGFLPWNACRRAAIFLGDGGSLFIGALFAGLSLMIVNASLAGTVYAAPLLLTPLLADVLVTLADRARRGRPLMEGHREHAYQQRLTAGEPHVAVARGVWASVAVCVVVAAAATSLASVWGGWVFCAGFVLTATAATLRRMRVFSNEDAGQSVQANAEFNR